MDFVAQPKEEEIPTNLLIIGSFQTSGSCAIRCRPCSHLKYLRGFYTEIISINVDWHLTMPCNMWNIKGKGKVIPVLN
jgi:hypothetical protein